MIDAILFEMEIEELEEMRDNYAQAYLIQRNEFQLYMIQQIDRMISEKEEQLGRTRK